MALNKDDQRFLRYMMAVKSVPMETCFHMYKRITGASTFAELTESMSSINSIIKQLDLELSEGESEVSGLRFMSLIQMSEKAPPESCKYSDKKKDVIFAKILSCIALSAHKKISKTEAINACVSVCSNKGTIETALSSYESENWLECYSGYLYFGARTICELGSLIARQYPSAAISCSLCQRHVFYGLPCIGCGSRTHKACLKRFAKQNGREGCPKCQGQIDKDDSIAGPSAPKRARHSK